MKRDGETQESKVVSDWVTPPATELRLRPTNWVAQVVQAQQA